MKLLRANTQSRSTAADISLWTIVAFFILSIVHAQDTSSPARATDSTSSENFSELHSSDFSSGVTIGLEQPVYLSSKLTPSQASSGSFSPQIRGGLKSHSDDPWLGGGIDAYGVFDPDVTARSHFNAREAYMGSRLGQTWSKIQVGRVLKNWNHADQFWNLGIWQAQDRWDEFDRDDIGLTGLFAEARLPITRLTFFASPLYIPELGAPFDLSEQGCTSYSPWFSCPPETGLIFDQPTALRYRLYRPEISEILFQPSFAVSAHVGGDRGFYARPSAAYKPMNQLLIGYEGALNIQTLEAEVDIYPRVIQHRLLGADLGWKTSQYHFVASLMHEQPIRDRTPAAWTTQEVAPAWIGSIVMSARPWEAAEVSVGWMRLVTQYLGDQGGLPAGQESAFASRWPFSNTLRVSGRTPIPWILSRRLSFHGSYQIDLPTFGTMTSANLNFRAWRTLQVYAGADFLSLGRSNRRAGLTTGADFVGRFRGNDRVRAGVRYVF